MPRSSTIERGASSSRASHRVEHRGERVRVVVAVLDGYPLRHVDPIVSPTLHRLRAETTTVAPALSVLASASIPNVTTFTTGVDPTIHGVFADDEITDGPRVRVTATTQRSPTLFQACSVAGRRAVWCGDAELGRFLAAPTTDCGADDATATSIAMESLEGDSELVVLQLASPSAAGMLHDPDSDNARSMFHDTDSMVRGLLDSCASDWERTVFIVVSTHDQLSASAEAPVELRPLVDRLANMSGHAPSFALQGDAAVLRWDDTSLFTADATPFDGVPGVEGRLRAARGFHIIWAPRGRTFCLDGTPDVRTPSVHGGPYTRAQVAIVSGGHPLAATMRRSLARRAVRASDWAPTIADALGVPLPTATGVSLIDPISVGRSA